MSFLKKFLGKSTQTNNEDRVRVCSQCGMSVTEHKPWCSILKGQQEGTGAQLVQTAE